MCVTSKLAGKQSGRVSRALCEAASFAAEELDVKVIGIFTASGLMARRLSSLRPGQRIIAMTPRPEVRNELSLVWGVESLIHQPCDDTDSLLRVGEKTLVEAGVVSQGETLVFMAGRLSGMGLSSSVSVYTVGEQVPRQD